MLAVVAVASGGSGGVLPAVAVVAVCFCGGGCVEKVESGCVGGGGDHVVGGGLVATVVCGEDRLW